MIYPGLSTSSYAPNKSQRQGPKWFKVSPSNLTKCENKGQEHLIEYNISDIHYRKHSQCLEMKKSGSGRAYKWLIWKPLGV